MQTWPPDAGDLGEAFPAGDAKKPSHACQPIRSDAAKEDHVPRRYHLLSGRECDGFILVFNHIEYATKTSDGNYE
jgi:hypothetical protein